jgi:hypothetical protein
MSGRAKMVLKLFSDRTLSTSDLNLPNTSGRPGGSLLCIGSRTGLCQRLIISYRMRPVDLETLLDSDRMPLERVRSVEERV